MLDLSHGYVYLQADKPGILAFAEKHWRQYEHEELAAGNGRQIRNAFISAAVLARNERGEGPTAVLTERHFEGIANTVTAFDKYMAQARNALDSELARNRSDRHDIHEPGDEPEPVARIRRVGQASSARESRRGAGTGRPQTPTPSTRVQGLPQQMQSQQYYMSPHQAQAPLPANPQSYGGCPYPG